MDILEIKTGDLDKEVNNNVVVNMWSPHCINCKLTIYYLYHLQKEYPNISFKKYNIDEDSEFRNKYNINILPAIFFYKNGNLECRYYGTNQDTIKSILNDRY